MKWEVEIGGARFPNPVMVASGTFGYGEEFSDIFDLNRLGGIMVKGTGPRPRAGNPLPRIAETPSGMLNSIGLQNVGVDACVKEKIPALRARGVTTPIIVNMFGHTVDEFEEVARKLEAAGSLIQALELNLSCPNVQYASQRTFAHDPALTREVVGRVRKATRLPILAKLAPDVTDVVEIAKAAVDAGADGLSVTNTFPGMAIDADRRKPKLAMGEGGLSGPAIKPLALRLVWKVFQAVKVPIVGMGGIMSGQDAAEFLVAGASAVAVGTANFGNPLAAMEVLEGLEAFGRRHGLEDLRSLVGSLEVPARPA